MKKLFLVLISTILFTFSATAADMRIALVVKGLGIGFFEAAAEGGE
jgi:rhamnose transport system substrate-binding protein